MTVFRPVRPTDLVALVSFDGRIYPNEAKSCERLGKTESAPHPLESAIEQWFSFATGRHTWISVKGATLRGLVSARRRASRRVWEVDCLINAAEDDDAVCLGLLDQAVTEAARAGVEKVFLRLCSDSPVVPIARKAGFLEYVTEQLLFSRAPRFDVQRADSEGRLRKRTRGDEFPLFQLYNAVVPESVRRVEALTLAEWKANQDHKWLGARIRHYVLENDGQVTAWVRSAVNGESARFDVMVHPDQRKAQEALLDLTLTRLATRGVLMTLLPRYADGLRRSLLRRGFQQAQEYKLLVKRTTVAVKAAQLAPAIWPGRKRCFEEVVDKQITDDLEKFIEALPPRVSVPLQQRGDNRELLEVVLDLGRLPEARYPGREVLLSDVETSEEDIEYVVHRISEFGDDNRAGIERTLHRISAIRNRRGRIVGLTCRVGRAVFGTIRVIEDIIKTGKSTLLLGRPGVGKTTMLREVARVLADDMNKRVVIVDTSNEIAGDGDIPHPAIGSARRMQVRTPAMQHAVMIEGVENHMPEVIVIDEIGTELEAAAARTIAERGVQLVATAHGNTLENLMMNPTLSDLIGGIQSVTLGDEEARRRRTQKSILERKAPPTFNVVVEIQTYDRVAVHQNVAETVDAVLRGFHVPAEVREVGGDRRVRVLTQADLTRERTTVEAFEPQRAEPSGGPARLPRNVYPFGISRKRLEQAIKHTATPAAISEQIGDADLVITLRSFYRRKPQALREAEARGLPIYVLKNNTISQMEQSLLAMQGNQGRFDPVAAALQEAERAITEIMTGDHEVELAPQNAYIRRLQHQLAEKYRLSSRSLGREPLRRVRIYRENGSPDEEGGEHEENE